MKKTYKKPSMTINKFNVSNEIMSSFVVVNNFHGYNPIAKMAI